MKLINSSLTVLVFISAVYSAVMREGSEDLLRFLKDAFEMNLPLDPTESTPLPEMDLTTERILDPVQPTDPTVECKAPEATVNSADFSNTTPKPNSVELAGVAEERSMESSNSDSRLAERASPEDSREEENYKRLHLKTTLTDTHKALQEQYGNSAESMSVDRTDADIDMAGGSDKHINKATVVEDIGSQEMINGRYRPPRIQKLETHFAVVTGRQSLSSPIGFASRMNLTDQAGQPQGTYKYQQERRKSATDFDSPESVKRLDIPDLDDSEERGERSQGPISGIKEKRAMLDDSRKLADRIPRYTETSVKHPMEDNNSLDAPNVDQEIQKDTMSYQNQLRKICPTKRKRSSNNPRAQLDLDSPERVNSAPLDRDNSGERLEDHSLFPL